MVNRPLHPAVDWSTEFRDWRGLMVAVTCPMCHRGAGQLVSGVLQRIRAGNFTGRCTFCAAELRRGKKVQPMSPSPEIQAAILTERQRCVGLTLREYGIAQLKGATDVMEVLDRLAIYMENPETPPEG